MKNWSQAIEWNPSQVAKPSSEAEIQQLVQQAAQDGKNVRIIGTGHSFNPLWVTKDILINLDNYQGLVAVNKEQMLATVKAGTKLYTLGDLLFENGMAMENLGDIDRQSIAGTISTGTHGTGLAFGTISTQVVALRFVNGKGDIVICSNTENKDLFKAAQVSLGSLGVITEITLQCVAPYKLELWNRREQLGAVLSSFDSRLQENRNFEFYYFPHSDNLWTKTSNIAEGEETKQGVINYFTETVLENYAYKVLCEAAYYMPSTNKRVSKLTASLISDVRKVNWSHKVYTTTRLVRFHEMEYNLPLENFQAAHQAIRDLVTKNNFDIHFPIETRVVAADDAYISPAYGRDSVYISCHAYNKKGYEKYFKAAEEIFLAHGGRPHWGKQHFLKAADLRKRYPKFDTFVQHRNEQDPQGLFLNDYLKDLFVS